MAVKASWEIFSTTTRMDTPGLIKTARGKSDVFNNSFLLFESLASGIHWRRIKKLQVKLVHPQTASKLVYRYIVIIVYDCYCCHHLNNQTCPCRSNDVNKNINNWHNYTLDTTGSSPETFTIRNSEKFWF